MNVLDLIHPDYHVKFISFSDQIASGGRFHGETVELRKDRAEIWIEVRGGPIRRERELRFPGIARNVTEQRQSEEELRKYLNGHADADHGRL
jgi:PAS domain S-box-containing protein